MQIELISQEYNSQILKASLKSNKTVHFELKEKPIGSRPIDPNVLLAIIGAGTTILSGLAVTLINALKDLKLKEMELKHNSIEKEKDRKLSIEVVNNQRETELIKIEEQRKNIILEGAIEVVGNYKNSLIKGNVQKNVNSLKSKGIGITENSVLIPISLLEESTEEIEEILNLENVKELIHRK